MKKMWIVANLWLMGNFGHSSSMNLPTTTCESSNKQWRITCNPYSDHTRVKETIYNAAHTTTMKATLPEPSTHAIFSHNNEMVALLTPSFATKVCIYNLITKLSVIKLPIAYVEKVYFCHDDTRLIITTNHSYKQYIIWDIIDNKQLYSSKQNGISTPLVAINATPPLAAFIHKKDTKNNKIKNVVYLHNLNNGSRITTFKTEQKNDILTALYFCNENQKNICLRVDGSRFSKHSNQPRSISPLTTWALKNHLKKRTKILPNKVKNKVLTSTKPADLTNPD